MKIIKRIISNTSIGHEKNGDNWLRVDVEYTDDTDGTMYRMDNHDGKVHGLQATHPAIVAQHRIVSLFQEMAA